MLNAYYYAGFGRKCIYMYVFTSKASTRVGFSLISVYWTSRGHQKRYFTEATLINDVSCLMRKCHFIISNTVFKENVGVPMGLAHFRSA